MQNGALGSPYLGFSSLYVLYAWAKSIDDASSAGGDKNILTPVGGQTDGQIAFGGTRSNDRSASAFDQRHVINGAYIYDLPFGQGRQLMNHAWRPLEFLVGGWTMYARSRQIVQVDL